MFRGVDKSTITVRVRKTFRLLHVCARAANDRLHLKCQTPRKRGCNNFEVAWYVVRWTTSNILHYVSGDLKVVAPPFSGGLTFWVESVIQVSIVIPTLFLPLHPCASLTLSLFVWRSPEGDQYYGIDDADAVLLPRNCRPVWPYMQRSASSEQ